MTNREGQDNRESQIDAAFAEYLSRLDREGSSFDLDSFLNEHPSIADELRDLIEMASTVETMASGSWQGTEDTQHFRVDDDSNATVETQIPSDEKTQREPAPSVVRLFGEYELIEELGRGGMGIVYKARQKSIARLVALKMIIGGRYSTEDSIRRFYREAKAAGKLSHPNIVRAYQAGEHDGRHYFAMELIEGQTLRNVLKEKGRLPTETVVRYMQQLADAIHFAHENGVLHRDLKPSNIIVNQDDVPKIADFGLAKHVDPDADYSFESSSGAVIGTPSYMAPEQAAARRGEVGPQSDVYSLGAIFYELLTGSPPFQDESPVATLLLVVNQEVTPPSDLNSACHPALEAICLKCLEKDPKDRYLTGQEMAEDLSRFARGEPVKARRLTVFHRAWIWLRAIPLIAVLLGRHSPRASKLQRRTQAGVIAAALLACGILVFGSSVRETFYLKTIQIGVGQQDGEYERVGAMIGDALPDSANRVELVNSDGSVHSRTMLLDFKIDLCVMQDNTVIPNNKEEDDLAIITPLFQEAVLVIVRKDSEIHSIAELNGKPIALGRPESGSRITSDNILSRHNISTASKFRDFSWTELSSNTDLMGAIGTVGLRDQRLTQILATGQFRIVPWAIDQLPPWLRPQRFLARNFPAEAAVPASGLESATVQAVLAVRRKTPDWFVESCLQRIFLQPNHPIQDHIFAIEDVSNWSSSRSFHPAARRFFAENFSSE